MDITNQVKTLTTLDVTTTRAAPVANNNNTTGEKVVREEVTPSINLVTKQKPEEVLATAVSNINNHIQNIQRSLQFTVDEASGKDVVTVLDKETEEVIRQFPSDEVLAIARQLAEQNGDDLIQLFNSKA
jgi:flagellar protein FlaG